MLLLLAVVNTSLKKMAYFRWKQMKFAFSQSIIAISFLCIYLFSLFPGVVVTKMQHLQPQTENTQVNCIAEK